MNRFIPGLNWLWTPAERNGICDVAIMSQTTPNELHRAKKTLTAVLEAGEALLRNDGDGSVTEDAREVFAIVRDYCGHADHAYDPVLERHACCDRRECRCPCRPAPQTVERCEVCDRPKLPDERDCRYCLKGA